MTEKTEYIVLPDLDKKIDEAVHDALNFFDKKCPYCDTLLFTGHIRNKIQLDHYFPIAKGGQHVPWNILPVCQNCNSKKHAKKPKLFLSQDQVDKCNMYLKTIKEKYIGQVQNDLEKYQQIKSIFIEHSDLTEIIKNRITVLEAIYEIINGNQLPQERKLINFIFDLESAVEQAINKLYRIPGVTDEIKKYSVTELFNIIQPLVDFQIPKNSIGKGFRRLGFYYRLERINRQESKRVFYVTEIKEKK